jgi:uncharacterized protein (DUF1778 family)
MVKNLTRSLERPGMAAATETLNIRVQPAAKDLIDRAAKAVGKNRTEFIIAAAHREAEAVLMNQRLFMLDGEAFEAFNAALDQPPQENPELRRLLETPAPWDK